MARRRVTPLWPIALSPARLADCLDLHRSVIDAAIRDGHLPVYQNGTKRRILIQDCVAWIVSTWKRKGARYVPS